MTWTRRQIARWLSGGAAAVAAGIPKQAPAAAGRGRAKVVVIGGGPGGATVARYLAARKETLDVTLVEAARVYTTCFFSNLYLGELRSYESLQQSYIRLATDYGITVAQDFAEAIDPDRRNVLLRSGASLPYDRLVLAPGIDFTYDAIAGYDAAAAEIMPHAWRGGAQTRLLKQRLDAMENGGLVIIAPPAAPYRCPPGPYERASMIAHYLKRAKPASKILILDSKDRFSKQALFLDAWQRYYPDLIEWVPASFTGGVRAVDAKSGEVFTEDETFKPAVANIIPPQAAGGIARQLELADGSGWCPVHATTLESLRQSGIHLVGDAIDPGDMPKSAFSANSQAKVCAMAVASALLGTEHFDARFRNTCWSHVTAEDAVMIGANYRAVDGRIRKVDDFVSQVGESQAQRAQSAREARGWYSGFVADVFG